MGEIFFISDTHFNHKNIINLSRIRREKFNNIEEHDEALIENWNKVIRKRDTVWHLGDVLFGKKTFEILTRLNGIKKLIKGNHDTYNAKKYLEYFNDVCGVVQFKKDFLLSHVPVIHSGERWKVNIHGHLHEMCLNSELHFCVNVEEIDFKPISFEEIKQRLGL